MNNYSFAVTYENIGEYLHLITDTEIRLNHLDQEIKNVDNRDSKIDEELPIEPDFKALIKKPVKPIDNSEAMERTWKEQQKNDSRRNGCLASVGVLFALFGLIAGLISESTEGKIAGVAFFIIGLTLFLCVFLKWLLEDIHEKKRHNEDMEEYKEKYKELYKKYEQEYSEYEHRVENAKKQFDMEWTNEIKIVQEKHEYLRVLKRDLEKEKQDTISVLEQLYSLNIVYPKYRGLVPMSTIFEYFSSGRCAELQGADGAYNLFEMELRQNIIINNLDKINQNLESIKTSQYVLFEGLNETNTTLRNIDKEISGQLDSISKGIEHVVQNSEIARFHMKNMDANINAIKWLKIFIG